MIHRSDTIQRLHVCTTSLIKERKFQVDATKLLKCTLLWYKNLAKRKNGKQDKFRQNNRKKGVKLTISSNHLKFYYAINRNNWIEHADNMFMLHIWISPLLKILVNNVLVKDWYIVAETRDYI